MAWEVITVMLLICTQSYITAVSGQGVVYNASGLTAIPTDIPSNVTRLELDHNDFPSIPARAFSQYTLLETLYLTYSKITSIADDAFDGCPIKYLYLQKNDLASIRQLYCLDPIKLTLRDLNLSDNPIYPTSDPDFPKHRTSPEQVQERIH